MSVENLSLAVIMPAYNASMTLPVLIDRIPSCVDWIIIVDDASSDETPSVVCRISDMRVVYIRHEKNLGVGGAMITGFKKALELRADLVAKVDADGQMDPQYLDRFAKMATIHGCDYVKANRFGHKEALMAMPKIRLIGGLILTFLTKFASGYWGVFDTQNGYVMITRQMLLRLDLGKLNQGYFFENSMLIHLNTLGARIGEIYLPAKYGNEISFMRLSQVIITFPMKLLWGLFQRVYKKYISRIFSLFSLLLTISVITTLWGVGWGCVSWLRSTFTGVPATLGENNLSILSVICGSLSFVLAMVLDARDAPPRILLDHDDESLRNQRIHQSNTG